MTERIGPLLRWAEGYYPSRQIEPPDIAAMNLTDAELAVGGGENPRINGAESVPESRSSSHRAARGSVGPAVTGNQPSLLMVKDGCPATLCKRWPTAPAFGCPTRRFPRPRRRHGYARNELLTEPDAKSRDAAPGPWGDPGPRRPLGGSASQRVFLQRSAPGAGSFRPGELGSYVLIGRLAATLGCRRERIGPLARRPGAC